MLTVGIITNHEKDKDFIYTKIAVSSIIARGAGVRLTDEIAGEIGVACNCANEDAVISASDIVICLGGDGTFLRAARKAHKYERPLLGINLGTLGFLTEVDKHDIDEAVRCLVYGKFSVENRMMLEMCIKHDGGIIAKDVALNDVVISRKALSRILHLKTYVNNDFIDSFPGDGLIISSPTGSTAYSLSAGGPIVEPDTELIIITPICPHILYSRSFITTGVSKVNVEVDEMYGHDAMVTVDGQKGYDINKGYSIEISKSPVSTRIVRINPRNFFNVLRTKIYDRGESLRKNEV